MKLFSSSTLPLLALLLAMAAMSVNCQDEDGGGDDSAGGTGDGADDGGDGGDGGDDGGEQVIDCTDPMSIGRCKMAVERFFYNASADECESFVWGGCGANGNNFESLEECDRACVRRQAAKGFKVGNCTVERVW